MRGIHSGRPRTCRFPNLGAWQAEGLQPRRQPRATGVRPEFLRIIASFVPIFSHFFEIGRLPPQNSDWTKFLEVRSQNIETSEEKVGKGGKKGKRWL